MSSNILNDNKNSNNFKKLKEIILRIPLEPLIYPLI